MLQELPDSRCSDNDLPVGNTVEGSKGLLKWKGVVFTPEDGANSTNSPEDSISQITETDEAGSQVSHIYLYHWSFIHSLLLHVEDL